METNIVRLALVLVLAMTWIMPGAQAAEREITIAGWLGGRPTAVGEAWDTLKERFEAQNTKYKVEVDTARVGLTSEELIIRIASGLLPDVYIEDRFGVPELAFQGIYQSLDNIVQRAGLNRSHYIPGPWQECELDGQLFCIPTHTDARGLFYNTRLLAEAGFEPKSPKSWEELAQMATKLTRVDHNQVIQQLGFNPAVLNNSGTLYLMAFGANIQIYDPELRAPNLLDPRMVDALAAMADLYQKLGGRGAIQAFYQGKGGANGAFRNEHQAINLGQNAEISTLVENFPDVAFDVAPLPPLGGGNATTWGGGFGLTAPTGVQETEALSDFAKFFLSEESQYFYGISTTHIPLHFGALQRLIEDVDPRQAKFYQMAQTMHFRPGGPVARQMYLILRDAINQALDMELSPRAALESAQHSVEVQVAEILGR